MAALFEPKSALSLQKRGVSGRLYNFTKKAPLLVSDVLDIPGFKNDPQLVDVTVGSVSRVEEKARSFVKVTSFQERPLPTKVPEPEPEPEQVLQCEICGKPMKSIQGLTAHMRIVHPSANAEGEGEVEEDESLEEDGEE